METFRDQNTNKTEIVEQETEEKKETKGKEEKNGKKTVRVNLLELFFVFFKVGTFTIGGGYAMLPLIQEEVIKNKKWLNTREFMDILGITQSLPGPLIINFALLAGYRLKGVKGGLFALLGAILPSFVIILVIAVHLWQFGENRAVQAAFQGIRPAVVALILFAAIKLGKEILRQRFTMLLFLLCLGILLFFQVHPVVVIIIGALAGFLRPYFFKSTKRRTEN